MNQRTVSADGMHCAGNWQAAAGFAADYGTLHGRYSDPDMDEVYELTVRFRPGPMSTNSATNAWGSDEGVPSGCAVNGNRGLTVAATDILLPAFASPARPVLQVPSPTFNVVFEVDMSTTCDVDSRRHCRNDEQLERRRYAFLDPDGDGVYSITLTIDSGEVQYKVPRYFNGSANWEGRWQPCLRRRR